MTSSTLAPGVLAKLYETRKYSDFILVCHGKEIPVHKSVVCTRSPVMAAACDGGFDLKTVERMIEFMYTDNYEDGHKAFTEDLGCTTPKTPESFMEMADKLLLNANMNVIGNYYDIPELRKLAVKTYEFVSPHISAYAFQSFSPRSMTARSMMIFVRP
ncbi:POZ [Glarea lozoyensis ATCC 20868]|uniref:POZ n=1 Tax=Glarea lozoyensis (strain ATCC 20868 / MF5171) TaxID=1116229 RepID=S3CWC8_GLAL2|nr:POZ [Glarea lozoyensis ATCC 20868]EPE29940.1 POZ [Glarea lozoyensis ATCC 20868]